MLTLIPVTRDQAIEYLINVHRHHGRPVGYRFAVGVAKDGVLVGVAMAGRPVARHSDDGRTIEVVRLATDGTKNACSILYGACWRAGRALGYTRAITYTLATESGESLRGAGWLKTADLRPRPGWDTPSRMRIDRGVDDVARIRWEIRAVTHAR
jgi:hypothetical protein